MRKFWSSATIAGPLLCVLQIATGPPASAFDRQIELTNNTRMVIVEVYAAPIGGGRGPRDLLGDEVLAPTESLRVGIETGTGNCRFDLSIVFDDGTNLTRREINICGMEHYTISYR